MPLIATAILKRKAGIEQYHDEEMVTTRPGAQHVDSSDDNSCHPHCVFNPIDESTKVRLALRTSQATIPGAVHEQTNHNSSRDKSSWMEMEWAYRLIRKNRRGFTITDTHRTTPNEEQPLDELQERMHEFKEEANKLDRKDQVSERKRARNRAMCCTLCVAVAVIFFVVVGMLIENRTRQESAAKRGDAAGPAADEIEADQFFTECLADPLYASAIVDDIKTFLVAGVAPATADAMDTPGSYQRAALCWLSEVDEFFESALENGTLKGEDMIELNQRFALTSIYYHLVPLGSSQAEDLSKSNWLSNLPACEWDFIGCGNSLEVTELFLENTNLNSVIPVEVAQLSDLVYLRLNHCRLTGNIPSELFNLTKLEVLDLSLNTLDGTIPSEITQLEQLRHLDLSDNELFGEIPALPFNRLVSFIIGYNAFSGRLPSALSTATNLTTLDLASNSLTGTIPPLSQLTNLQLFSLESTRFEDAFPDISSQTNLELVDLSGISLTGTIPSYVWLLPKLRTLILADTTLVGSIPSTIGLLTTLEHLNLSIAKYSGTIPTELGNLSNLAHLDLELIPRLSGTFPTELGRLTKLSYLALPQTGPSGTVPSDICDLLLRPDSALQWIYGPSASQCHCCNSVGPT